MAVGPACLHCLKSETGMQRTIAGMNFHEPLDEANNALQVSVCILLYALKLQIHHCAQVLKHVGSAMAGHGQSALAEVLEPYVAQWAMAYKHV